MAVSGEAKLSAEKDAAMAALLSTPEERDALREELGGIEYDVLFDIQKDPYNYMMKILFSRWKPFLLQAIASDERTYFSRFTKQLPITQKVLSSNLKELTEDGLIQRNVIADVIPPRVEYTLTNRGKTLIPLLNLIYDWGWNDMRRHGMPVDALGEMWHGYREKDERFIESPFYKNPNMPTEEN